MSEGTRPVRRKVTARRHSPEDETAVAVAEDTGLEITKDNPGGLPPAGAARLETLLKRKDELEKDIEELANELQLEAIDPKALEPDRELQDILSKNVDPNTGIADYEIDNPDPSMHYRWIQCQYGAGRFVLMAKRDGYKIVTGQDTYRGKPIMDRSMLRPDNTYVIGDVVLMGTTIENYNRLEENRRALAARFDEAPRAALEEKGSKLGVEVHTDPNDPMLRDMYTRAQASGIAAQRFTGMLKDGTVPGLPAAGRS